MKTLTLSLIFSFIVLSCSSPSPRESRLDVRPGVDGIHRVVLVTKNKVDGTREALLQADQYCKEISKAAYFFNSSTNEDSKGKNPTHSSVNPPAAKKATPDDAEAEKTLTIDMMFKCL